MGIEYTKLQCFRVPNVINKFFKHHIIKQTADKKLIVIPLTIGFKILI